MKECEHITDEMMVRYLSGKATPEEEVAILDYIAESDENFDDFLAMSAAIKDYETIGQQDLKPEETPAKKSIFNFHFSTLPCPALSAAASVALLVGVGIALWHNSQSGSELGVAPSPAYATQDTLVEPIVEDSL